jgi:hypothetical protein
MSSLFELLRLSFEEFVSLFFDHYVTHLRLPPVGLYLLKTGSDGEAFQPGRSRSFATAAASWPGHFFDDS